MSVSSSEEVRFVSRAKELLRKKGQSFGSVVVSVTEAGDFIDVYDPVYGDDEAGEGEVVVFDSEIDVNPAPEVDALDAE